VEAGETDIPSGYRTVLLALPSHALGLKVSVGLIILGNSSSALRHGERPMTFVASLIAIWIFGVLFLAGLLLNDIRLLHNNITPGEVPRNGPPSRAATSAAWLLLPPVPEWIGLGVVWALMARIFRIEPRSSDPLSGIDPGTLNDASRAYRARTIRHEWIMVVWVVAGFAIVAWCF
jgi:hypothetical protein